MDPRVKKKLLIGGKRFVTETAKEVGGAVYKASSYEHRHTQMNKFRAKKRSLGAHLFGEEFDKPKKKRRS